MLVSVATLIAVGDDYVRFGILHCIAVAMVVGPLLLPLGWWNVPLGAAAIAAGFALDSRSPLDVPGLFILGVPLAHDTVDWYPLLPWLGPMHASGWPSGGRSTRGGRRGRAGRPAAGAAVRAGGRRARAPRPADLPGAPGGADPAGGRRARHRRDRGERRLLQSGRTILAAA